MKERNAFVIVIGGDEAVGKSLIKCMLHKNPGSYFMFAGQEMMKLKNALKKFRKLSFMSDISYLQLFPDEKNNVESRYYVKMAAVVSKFESYTGMPLTEIVLVFTNCSKTSPIQTTSIYLPILKAFYRLASRFAVEATLVSALFDLSEKSSSLAGNIEREILAGLMESSFRQNRRNLRQFALITLDGIELNSSKKQDKIKTGVAILNLIENHSIIGISKEHIGNWTQIISKEASKTEEDLSFAKRMYNLMVGKVSNFVQLESFLKKDNLEAENKTEKKIKRGILNYSLIDTNNNRWLNRGSSERSSSNQTTKDSSPIFFISEDDNEEYSDSDELSCLPPNRRHSTDFSGSARISGCRQLTNKTSKEILQTKAPNVATKLFERQNTVS
ncbi:unnamed protein product [Oikopleura dioica]|uniref:Uncharacterized protein n=1 Tax=Oikopleura dioica TaxID=34765 RepID=E4X169_OIKDI|nr:unnamed protein product [Oikopleura dioica]